MMMRTYVAIFCAFAIAVAAPAAAQIQLNEILADPASDWDGDGTTNSRSDEWVEVVNVGTTTVDLSTYRLSDATEPEQLGRYGNVVRGVRW
jgi:hypothetical protein